MNIKDQIRDYDAAFNRARTAYGTGAYDDATLEFLFPQLRENEDERVRKEIISIVKAYRENCIDEGTHRFDDCLSWFEKQKEQKPEEKPVNWTELTWEDIVELEGIINNVHYEFHNGIGQESFGKEVLERFRSTKGIEYLDEAEQKYWREEGQKEQKPAEWSEEDKRKLNRIYEILGYAADDKAFLKSKRIIGDKEAIELQDFLKSLRPSWRPSEEQMKALQNAISEFDGYRGYDELRSLYNDLKKLM